MIFFSKYLILLLSHGMLRYIHNTTSVFVFIFMYLGKNIGHRQESLNLARLKTHYPIITLQLKS